MMMMLMTMAMTMTPTMAVDETLQERATGADVVDTVVSLVMLLSSSWLSPICLRCLLMACLFASVIVVNICWSV